MVFALSAKSAIATAPAAAAQRRAAKPVRASPVAFFGKKEEPAPPAKKSFFGSKKAPAKKAAAKKASGGFLSFLPGREVDGQVTEYSGSPISFLSGGRNGDFLFSASGGVYDKLTKDVRRNGKGKK